MMMRDPIHLSTPSQILLLAPDPVTTYARDVPFASVENFLVYQLLGKFVPSIIVLSVAYTILVVRTPLSVFMRALRRKGIKENETLHVATRSQYSSQRSIQFAWPITGRRFVVHSRKIHDLHAVHELIQQMRKMDMKVTYGF